MHLSSLPDAMCKERELGTIPDSRLLQCLQTLSQKDVITHHFPMVLEKWYFLSTLTSFLLELTILQ